MRYRLLSADERVIEDGEARADVADGVLSVVPADGEPLRVRLSDVADVLDVDSPGRLTLILRDGSTVQLTMLGRRQGALAADVLRHRAADVTRTLFLDGVGRPESFPCAVEVGAGDGGSSAEAEVRVYDDALVALPRSGPAVKLPFGLVREVRMDASGYRVEVLALNDRPLVLHRLARRTGEFVELLRRRVSDARVRTSSLVGALLPGLDAAAARQVATLLRDGVAADREALDAVDDTVFEALLRACTLPERLPGVATLVGLGDIAFGLHQTVSVERPATRGLTGLAGAQAPGARDHGGGPLVPGGLAGVVQGSLVAALGEPGGPGGGLGGGDALTTALWFGAVSSPGAVALGHHHRGTGPGHHHQERPRATPSTGRSLPAWTDLRALRVGGPEATVTAFVLVTTPSGHVVHEVLSEGDHATYVFGPGPGASAVNLALAQLGFRLGPVLAEGLAADSPVRRSLEQLPSLRLLRESFVGRVVHTDGWQERLESLLA